MNSATPERARRTRVSLMGRTFLVKLAANGAPLSIVERKVHAAGRPWEALCNATYWHHSQRIGGPTTMVRRILTEAGVDTRHIAGY